MGPGEGSLSPPSWGEFTPILTLVPIICRREFPVRKTGLRGDPFSVNLHGSERECERERERGQDDV